MSPHDGMECPMCGGVGRIFNITEAVTAAVEAGAVAVQPLVPTSSYPTTPEYPDGVVAEEYDGD